jgi:hypothetical protein
VTAPTLTLLAAVLALAAPAPDRPLVPYGTLRSFQVLDCIEDWMQCQ